MRALILSTAATLMLVTPVFGQAPLRGEELGRVAVHAVNTYTRFSIFDEVKVRVTTNITRFSTTSVRGCR